jgi:hypothetical protein
MQGYTRGTLVPFNAIPYGGGHIPPSSPSLGGAFQQPIGMNVNYRLFGEGILGPSSYTTLVGSMSFSLFNMFGNNMLFISFPSQLGETLVLGNKTLCRVLFLHKGQVQEFSPLRGFGILGRDQFPHKGFRSGKPLPWSMEPRQGSVPMPIKSAGGIPFQNPWNTT